MKNVKEIQNQTLAEIKHLFCIYGFTDVIPKNHDDFVLKLDLLQSQIQMDLNNVVNSECRQSLGAALEFVSATHDSLKFDRSILGAFYSHENDDWSDNKLNDECVNPLVHFE